MSRSQVLDTLATLTQHQHGFLTTAQAVSAGVTVDEIERLVRDAELEAVIDGVYHWSQETLPGFADVWAAWLQTAPERTAAERLSTGVDAVASHLTAADIHGLGVLESEWVCLTVATAMPSPNEDVKLFVNAFNDSDWSIIDGLPVMKPIRVVADLAEDGCDSPYLAAVVYDVVNRQLAERESVAAALAPFSDAYGMADGTVFLERLIENATSGFKR